MLMRARSSAAQGTNFGSDPLVVQVMYGTASESLLYPCVNITKLTPQGNFIQCTTTAGVGGQLKFRVSVNGVWSTQGVDTYSYPTPTITVRPSPSLSAPSSIASLMLLALTRAGWHDPLCAQRPAVDVPAEQHHPGKPLLLPLPFLGTHLPSLLAGRPDRVRRQQLWQLVSPPSESPPNAQQQVLNSRCILCCVARISLGDIAVTYGTTKIRVCAVVAPTTNTLLTCQTSPGTGVNYNFTVAVSPSSFRLPCLPVAVC